MDLAFRAAPKETGGLIFGDGTVVELPNYAPSPTDHIEMSREELLKAMPEGIDLGEVAIWHTHPGGGVGPSRLDIQQKTPFNYHLVVTLEKWDIICTWY